MNKYLHRSHLLLALFLVIGASSCYPPDELNFTENQVTYENISDFFINIENLEKQIVPKVEEGFVIAKENLFIHFEENSLIAVDGNVLTGNAEVKFSISGKNGDMILNDKPSRNVFDYESLHTYRVIYFDVYQDGKLIDLKDHVTAKVYWKTPPVIGGLEKLYVFEQKEWNNDFGWAFSNITTSNLKEDSWNQEFNGQYFSGSGYSFYINRGWSAIGSSERDIFPDVADYHQLSLSLSEHYTSEGITFQIPEAYDSENTKVFVSMKNRPAVFPLERGGTNLWRISAILANEDINICAISEINNQLFFAQKSLNSTDQDLKLTLTPIPSDAETVIQALQAF